LIFDYFFNSSVRYRFRLIRRFLRKGGRWHREKQGCGATAEDAVSSDVLMALLYYTHARS